MEGVRDDPAKIGVIPRTFAHIFDDHISCAPREEKYLVTASYLEIYQEEIRWSLSVTRPSALNRFRFISVRMQFLKCNALFLS
jgi:hypothetical protein